MKTAARVRNSQKAESAAGPVADTRLFGLTANDLAMEVLSETVADGWLTTVFMCDTERRRWKTLNTPASPLVMAQLVWKSQGSS